MRRLPPVWAPPDRSRSAIPPDVILAAAAVAVVWVAVFGVRRGSFWIPVTVASLAMLALVLTRAPRTEDVLMVHEGILVLGVGSGAVLFLLLTALGPITRRLPFLVSAVMKVYARVGSTPRLLVFLVILLMATAEELFWRGFVQGRLAETCGPRRAYRLTLFLYVLVDLLTLNLALAAAATICGGLWGWFRLRSGSIVPSALSHIVLALLMYYLYPV